MSLERECADVVRFECSKCERFMSMRLLFKTGGECPQCGCNRWTLITEYHEPNAFGQYRRRTVLPGPLRAWVEWMGWNRRQAYDGETITLRTPDVPKEDALALVKMRFG